MTNPAVRQAIKDVLSSDTSSPSDKEKIFSTMSRETVSGSPGNVRLYRRELRTISDEIVRDGGHINLAAASISGTVIDLNLNGANFENTAFTDVEFNLVDMSDANLKGTKFKDCLFFRSTMCGAATSGMTMEKISSKGLVISSEQRSKPEFAQVLITHPEITLLKIDQDRYVLADEGGGARKSVYGQKNEAWIVAEDNKSSAGSS